VRVCTYDGDDAVRVTAVEDKRIAKGETKTMTCNHETCDIAIDPGSNTTCAEFGNSVIDVAYCGDIYIYSYSDLTRITSVVYYGNCYN